MLLLVIWFFFFNLKFSKYHYVAIQSTICMYFSSHNLFNIESSDYIYIDKI